MKILRISIYGDKIDANDVRLDHVIDRVTAGTPDAHDTDSSEGFYVRTNLFSHIFCWEHNSTIARFTCLTPVLF
jgi:hypothetical protein